ncbi:mannitol-1-phosphate 5-dehydrogenase [Vagococcus acidifermentans]|uniref:Mannitol-1-phosphate 5-dehydrogenase n=1 Tax=Vagococcus acidifermentans TaxID=564710 RepID=A0A430AZ62_9ENTE|nr:mannitol-1-phosphate 5-dehydrogenase [Vagococcus acidifermentans]RSU13329.1 mannitol dehydrogenase [Vagococcus acidifermentans]
MKAVHFGAGNIGRGLIGQVLHNNDFEICFVDTFYPIVEQLNQDNGYWVEYINKNRTTVFIDQIHAICINDLQQLIKEIQTADLITTSVGVNNLEKIAPAMTEALKKRFEQNVKPINILANENVINASTLLKRAVYQELDKISRQLFDTYVSFVDTSIDRQALSKEETAKSIAVVEPYYEWIINKSQWHPNVDFELKDVTYVSEMEPYIERKLFIVNAAHAAFAYLGALFDCQTIQEVMEIPDILNIVRGFLTENQEYFVKKYQINQQELERFIENTLMRQGNPQLEDSIERVGRSPLRKLSTDDRLVGPVKKLANLGISHVNGVKVIAAAYLYSNPKDEEALALQQLLREQSALSVISNVSGLEGTLLEEVEAMYEQIKKNKELIFQGGGNA